jgi:hypothetical protein
MAMLSSVFAVFLAYQDPRLDDSIQVERTLYRVHRHFFKQYSQQFALDYELGNEPMTATLPPICLEDVETRDFEQLLSIFYPRSVHRMLSDGPLMFFAAHIHRISRKR